jgi:hypothetical protein
VGIAVYPLTMALATNPTMLLWPHLTGALLGSGMSIFMANIIYQVTPKDKYPTFAAIDATLANITGFIAPMLGVALMDAVGIHTALYIIAGLRVLGGLSFWRVGASAEK